MEQAELYCITPGRKKGLCSVIVKLWLIADCLTRMLFCIENWLPRTNQDSEERLCVSLMVFPLFINPDLGVYPRNECDIFGERVQQVIFQGRLISVENPYNPLYNFELSKSIIKIQC